MVVRSELHFALFRQWFCANESAGQETKVKSKTQVVLLGTGTPNADPDRSGPVAVAIIVNDTSYLVDFGPGVVRRAAAAHRMGISALAMPKLTEAFVTHLHSDHTAGYRGKRRAGCFWRTRITSPAACT
jgi:ribonuclease BN (tRNA processing enzyme)